MVIAEAEVSSRQQGTLTMVRFRETFSLVRERVEIKGKEIKCAAKLNPVAKCKTAARRPMTRKRTRL